MQAKLYTVLSRRCGDDYGVIENTFKEDEALERAIKEVKTFIEESHDPDLFDFEDAKKELTDTKNVYLDDLCEVTIECLEVELPTVYGIKYDINNDGWGLMDETFLTIVEAQEFLKKHVEKQYGDDKNGVVDEIEENGTWYIDDLCYFDIIQVV
ncbi:MAG: hypothetical protein ACRCTZ_14740 [Sarcina sp.]